MFYELIAALTAGFAAAGLMLLARRLFPAWPAWLVPAAAAFGLFAMTIYNEYSWASRTAMSLPEGVVVVSSPAQRSLFRPWSYLWPVSQRIMAVDQGGALRREGQVMADHYLFARWRAPQKVTSVYHCAETARADITEETRLDSEGRLQNATWRSVSADHPVLRLLCHGDEPGHA